ncbi:MAG: glycosyltransferase family 39 protein [Anaerolineae bacterium]|nr:glycosyltransferase family 39 protein [Anaerolineae bacterium]
MTARKSINQVEKSFTLSLSTLLTSRLSLSLSLFLLALLPRAYELQRFVTADEAKWVYRSAQFLVALLRGDFPATSVNLTPAVTTTWLGSLGLAVYYQLHQTALQQPFTAWLTSLPEFRTELDILAAARWPMVLLTSLSVVAFFLLLSRLFNPTLAFLAAAFIALDPHPVALARILGHDAPVMVFMSLSLLLLLLAVKAAEEQRSRGAEEVSASALGRPSSPFVLTVLSGIAAGLAFLSKAPALFLIPFAGLVFVLSEPRFSHQLSRFLVWLVVAYLTFVAFWPAAWVEPVGRPVAVFQNAFLSATDEEEASEEGYWRTPDLGPLYYLVNGGFKLSPLVMVGAGLAVTFAVKQRSGEPMYPRTNKSAGWHKEASFIASSLQRIVVSPFFWLIAFALLFTLFMTASDKRSPRYILPVFPPLAIIAAYGWLELYRVVDRRGRREASGGGSREAENKISPSPLRTPRSTPLMFAVLLLMAAFIILLPYAPYYFTYFNPLLGGSFSAPHLVKIGWGEGLDQVGRFLQRESTFRGSRVGTAYASTVAPFFEGNLSAVTKTDRDYLVLYLKQVQSGEPSPAFIRYFEQTGSLFSVKLNGIHYADVYGGPPLQTVPPGPHAENGSLTSNPPPIAFRPLTLYGHIGQTLDVDVLWQADRPLPSGPAMVSLTAPLTEEEASQSQMSQIPAVAQAEGNRMVLAPDVIISHHRLLLPASLARGPYALWVDGQLLGNIELRNFQIPADVNRVKDVVFDGQIALAGYQFEPTTDYLGVTLAWEAQSAQLPDYTVFVQILTAETDERLAGVDTPPLKGDWPTSRWVKGEVVVDEYLVAIPPDFPPGYYKVIVGLYRPETGQRLTLADGQDHWTLPWTFIRK